MVGLVDLRKRYDRERRHQPFHALLQLGDNGLTLGRGSRLARGDPASRETCFEHDMERLMVLLSAVCGRPVSPLVVKQAQRAAEHWRCGDKALAHIELAFARLPRLESENDAFRLFLAEALLDDGMSPHEAAAFAKRVFVANDLGSIGIHVLPYPGGVPKPNPRIR